MAYKTLDQEIAEAILKPHKMCEGCSYLDYCFSGNKGVCFCTKWEKGFKKKNRIEVTIKKNPELKINLPERKKSKKSVNKLHGLKGQKDLF